MYRINHFKFHIVNHDNIKIPDNLKLFYENNDEYDYEYHIHCCDVIDVKEKDFSLNKPTIKVIMNGLLEKRYLYLYGASLPYASYEEVDEHKAVVYVIYDMIEFMDIDTIFASLLALERRMQSFNQYILHSSFIQYNDHAILFSAPSGTGKSTQADLWKQYRNALIINGDRTLLSKNEYFIANGWPLCGSSEICFNEHYPLSCIVFLSQGKENNITELDYKDAYKKLISELTINYHNPLFINSAMDFIEDLLKNIKVYHLTCDISEDAVICLENKMKEDFVWMR